MSEGLVNIANQYKGLPMGDLIGAPLAAACEAQRHLAKSTVDFINDVGFEPPSVSEDGTVVQGAPRYVDFSFDRASQDEDGNKVIEEVHFRTPTLAVTPIPNLQVDSVNIVFDMEVSSSVSTSSSSDSEASFEGKAKYGFGLFSASVKVAGKTASHKENTRKSDNSAKYHVDVTATNHGMPEGLARVLDIYAEAAGKPSKVLTYKADANGDKDIQSKPELDTNTADADKPED